MASMMRILLTFIVTAFAFSTYATDLATTIRNTQREILGQQIDGNHWSGVYTLDVSTDAVALALGEKTKLISPELRQEIIDSIFLRIHPSQRGWALYPGGEVDLDITAITLFALQAAGVKVTDSRVNAAWAWYWQQKPLKKLGPFALIHLIPLGAIPRNSLPEISVRLLEPSKYNPLRLEKTGILKGIAAPFITWNYYFAKNHSAKEKTKDNEDAWAQEGIRSILEKENPTGGWYTINFTFINAIALMEAQEAGAGDFSENISRAWQKVLSWRAKNFEGVMVQQALLSDVWDTAGVVNAVNNVPSVLKENFDSNAAVKWLDERAIRQNNGSSLAWSFDSSDKSYPDVDDTAAAVHALSSNAEMSGDIDKAVNWILNRQNHDGGFPAWTKGISSLPYKFMRVLFKELPEVEDISQSDITSRVIYVLKNVPQSDAVKQSIARACAYLGQRGSKVKGVPVKIEPGHWMSDYFYSAAMELGGLVQGECNYQRQRELSDWLMSQQNPDGGWGESNESYTARSPIISNSTLLQSSLVLAGLVEYNKKLRAQGIDDRLNWTQDFIERGIDFLITKSNGGKNFFEKEFTAVVVKGKAFNRYELVPSYSSLYVLSEWYKIKSRSDTQ